MRAREENGRAREGRAVSNKEHTSIRLVRGESEESDGHAQEEQRERSTRCCSASNFLSERARQICCETACGHCCTASLFSVASGLLSARTILQRNSTHTQHEGNCTPKGDPHNCDVSRCFSVFFLFDVSVLTISWFSLTFCVAPIHPPPLAPTLPAGLITL